MLDNLTQRLAKVVKTMRGEARLTEANTAEMLREVRLALLEADVALPAVREFIAKVKEKALGEDVIQSLTPGQALVGVVQRELAAIMGADLGPEASQLSFAQQPPAIILMAGLQGVGKTTTVGKLAKYLKEEKKKKVLTVSADVYRPAAIAQLQSVTAQVGLVIIELGANDGLRGLPVAAAENNLRAMAIAAQQDGAKVVLIGMRMPPNYGRDYTEKFFAMYGVLSKEIKVPLVPFMLDGVADKPQLIQADGLHPLAVANPTILANIWPTVEKTLKAR